jgi:hypothetical protein
MNTEPTNRFIALTETMCDGVIPEFWEHTKDTPDRPITFATQREAWKEIADFQIMRLQDFIDDDTRDDDEMPEFEPDGWVVPCTLYPDGRIEGADGTPIYDPKEDPSKYGR